MTTTDDLAFVRSVMARVETIAAQQAAAAAEAEAAKTAPPDPRWATPGTLAAALKPATVQTPALDLVDDALVELANSREGRLIISMPPQEGKALALDTPVPTPTGWTTIGELQPGDRVLAGSGAPCRVTWVSPVWTGRDCYEVTTRDGERIVADAAHEWVARLDRRRSARLVKTVELARPRAKAAQIETDPDGLALPRADLPLDPYVLGVWLGDGHTHVARITSPFCDGQVRQRFADAGWPLRHLGDLDYSMAPEGWQGRTSKPSPARTALAAAGVLHDKHVPMAYLRASRVQRLALLQGLVDSDGHVTEKGQVEFTSTRKVLAEGVRELVYSLGAKAVMAEDRARLNGKDCGPRFRVRFYFAGAAHLERKAARCKDSSVASVRYVRAQRCASTPTVCIEVDSPDHTFLAGRTMLPTHNSTRATQDFVVWVLKHLPWTRVLNVSYGQALANRNGRTIRNLVTSSPALGMRIAADNGSASEWQLAGHDGGVFSIGIQGGATGRAGDLIVIDDPIKDRAQADSELHRDRVWDWWTDVAATRFGPNTRVVLILTRWHDDDLAGRLLKGEDKHLWRELRIPAQADHDPNAGETDPLGREPGEYLESARGRTTAQWEATKVRVGSRTWQALYQGRPSAAGGKIFNKTWWREYTDPLWVDRPDGSRLLLGFDDVLQSWDMTFKDTKSSDYVVGQVWARRGAHAYLVDQVRARLDFPGTIAAVRQLSARYPQAVLKLVEDKANGPAVIASLAHQVPGIVPVEPDGGKIARATAVSPLVEARGVWLPSPELAPWVGDFIEEHAAFPTGAHDDQVDGTSQGLGRLILQPLLAGEDLYEVEDLDDELAEFHITPY